MSYKTSFNDTDRVYAYGSSYWNIAIFNGFDAKFESIDDKEKSIDCQLSNVSFDFDCGNINDIFAKAIQDTSTGNFESDYVFVKGQELSIYLYTFDNASNLEKVFIGNYIISDVVESQFGSKYSVTRNFITIEGQPEYFNEKCPDANTLIKYMEDNSLFDEYLASFSYSFVLDKRSLNIFFIAYACFHYYGYGDWFKSKYSINDTGFMIDIYGDNYAYDLGDYVVNGVMQRHKCSGGSGFDITQYTLADLYTFCSCICGRTILAGKGTNASAGIENKCVALDSKEKHPSIKQIDYIKYSILVNVLKEENVDATEESNGYVSKSVETKTIDIYKSTELGYYKTNPDGSLSPLEKDDVSGIGIEVNVPLVYRPYSYGATSEEAYKNAFISNVKINDIKTYDFAYFKAQMIFSEFSFRNQTYVIGDISDEKGVAIEGDIAIYPYKKNITYDGGVTYTMSTGDEWQNVSDNGNASSLSCANSTSSCRSGGSNVSYYDLLDAFDKLQTKVSEITSNAITLTDVDNYLTSGIKLLKAESATIKDLVTKSFSTETLKAKVAEIDYLTSDNAIIKNIQSQAITTDYLKAESANLDWATILNATITDAMIESVSADKILSGTIYTNNVNIQSQNGGILISDNTQQFKDAAGNIRMQIGQDADGNFNYSIFGDDGKTAIFDENGIRTADAIPNGLIKDIKIAGDANISAGKLDIASLFKVINDDGTHTLNSSKILYNETNSTLDIVMSQMTSNIESLTNVAYGQVITYNVDEIPTLKNYPAYDWIVPMYPSETLYPSEDLIFEYNYDEYRKHIGAVCYLNDSTDSYRFCMAEDGTFYWKLIEDSETAVINTKISKLEMTTDGLKSDVGEMQQTISGQQSTIEQMSSSIEQNENSISLCVSKTTYDNGMAGKVSTKSVISAINQSAEEIKISADKLTLEGLITAKGLEDGTTTIDGECIKTGAIVMTMDNSKTPFLILKSDVYNNELSPYDLSLYYNVNGIIYSSSVSAKSLSLNKYNSSIGKNCLEITSEGFTQKNDSKIVSRLSSSGDATFNKVCVTPVTEYGTGGIKEWFKTSYYQVPTAREIYDYLYTLGLL